MKSFLNLNLLSEVALLYHYYHCSPFCNVWLCGISQNKDWYTVQALPPRMDRRTKSAFSCSPFLCSGVASCSKHNIQDSEIYFQILKWSGIHSAKLCAMNHQTFFPLRMHWSIVIFCKSLNHCKQYVMVNIFFPVAVM